MTVRDRLAAALIDHWPSPWYGSEKQRNQVYEVVDVLIAEFGRGD